MTRQANNQEALEILQAKPQVEMHIQNGNMPSNPAKSRSLLTKVF